MRGGAGSIAVTCRFVNIGNGSNSSVGHDADEAFFVNGAVEEI